MINQIKIGLGENCRVYACPTSGGNGVITSGMPVLIGTQAAVAMDTDTTTSAGGPGSPVTFWLDGSYGLTVIAQSQLSPVSGLQINPGDELFASGTLDVTTGITYNLTIDKTRGNTPFGNYEGPGPILAGTTNTYASVRLKTGGSPGPYAS